MNNKHYTAEERRSLAPQWGRKGGSPLLLALKRGKRITIDGKRYIPKRK